MRLISNAIKIIPLATLTSTKFTPIKRFVVIFHWLDWVINLKFGLSPFFFRFNSLKSFFSLCSSVRRSDSSKVNAQLFLSGCWGHKWCASSRCLAVWRILWSRIWSSCRWMSRFLCSGVRLCAVCPLSRHHRRRLTLERGLKAVLCTSFNEVLSFITFFTLVISFTLSLDLFWNSQILYQFTHLTGQFLPFRIHPGRWCTHNLLIGLLWRLTAHVNVNFSELSWLHLLITASSCVSSTAHF